MCILTACLYPREFTTRLTKGGGEGNEKGQGEKKQRDLSRMVKMLLN